MPQKSEKRLNSFLKKLKKMLFPGRCEDDIQASIFWEPVDQTTGVETPRFLPEQKHT